MRSKCGKTMKCHYIKDESGHQILIPGCMGTAAFGIHRCTCEKSQYKSKKKNVMKVKIKKLHKDAAIPKYGKPGDAGMDLTATEIEYKRDGHLYKTGIAIEIPKGYVGLLFPRSSVSKKKLSLSNSVGVIDSGYRGEIMFSYRLTQNPNHILAQDVYQVGERVGQIVIMLYPEIEFLEVEDLTDTERGVGSFGSTGK